MTGCGGGGCGCGARPADVIDVPAPRDVLGLAALDPAIGLFSPDDARAGALDDVIAGLDDPYLRWRAASELSDPVVVLDGHIGWVWERHWDGEHEGWATVIGDDPDVVARVIDALSALRSFEGVTVRSSVVDGLPERLRLVERSEWCAWMLDPADVTWDRDPAVVVLDRADPRIDGLLDHSPSAYIRSDDETVTHWLGIECGDDLVAVAAMHPEPSGAAHIVSVCTHPEARGQRLAERVCRTLMRIARDDGVPMLYLEMYAGNESGRALYTRLGMRQAPTFTSAQLPPLLLPH